MMRLKLALQSGRSRMTFAMTWPKRKPCLPERMSELGQTEKNSVRAYVFGFTLSTGHCSAQSALRICSKRRHRLGMI